MSTEQAHYWAGLVDAQNYPGVQHFDSIPSLVLGFVQLEAAEVSRSMLDFHEHVRSKNTAFYQQALADMQPESAEERMANVARPTESGESYGAMDVLPAEPSEVAVELAWLTELVSEAPSAALAALASSCSGGCLSRWCVVMCLALHLAHGLCDFRCTEYMVFEVDWTVLVRHGLVLPFELLASSLAAPAGSTSDDELFENRTGIAGGPLTAARACEDPWAVHQVLELQHTRPCGSECAATSAVAMVCLAALLPRSRDHFVADAQLGLVSVHLELLQASEALSALFAGLARLAASVQPIPLAKGLGPPSGPARARVRGEGGVHRPMEPGEVLRMYQAVQDVGELLDLFGLSWSASGGSLLAAVRNGGLLPYYDDFDMDVLLFGRADLELIDSDRFLDYVSKLGYTWQCNRLLGKCNVYSATAGRPCVLRDLGTVYSHSGLVPDCLFDFGVYLVWCGAGGQCSFTTRVQSRPHVCLCGEARQRISFGETHVWGLRNATGYLDAYFGPGWATTVPSEAHIVRGLSWHTEAAQQLVEQVPAGELRGKIAVPTGPLQAPLQHLVAQDRELDSQWRQSAQRWLPSSAACDSSRPVQPRAKLRLYKDDDALRCMAVDLLQDNGCGIRGRVEAVPAVQAVETLAMYFQPRLVLEKGSSGFSEARLEILALDEGLAWGNLKQALVAQLPRLYGERLAGLSACLAVVQGVQDEVGGKVATNMGEIWKEIWAAGGYVGAWAGCITWGLDLLGRLQDFNADTRPECRLEYPSQQLPDWRSLLQASRWCSVRGGEGVAGPILLDRTNAFPLARSAQLETHALPTRLCNTTGILRRPLLNATAFVYGVSIVTVGRQRRLEVPVSVHAKGCVMCDSRWQADNGGHQAALPQTFMVTWACHISQGGRTEKVEALSASSFNLLHTVLAFPLPNWVDAGAAAELALEATHLQWFIPDVWVCGDGQPVEEDVSVCGTMFYNMGSEAATHAARQWLEYHRLVGVKRIFVYDYDGSMHDAVAPDLHSGFVRYFPRFARTFGEEEHRLGNLVTSDTLTSYESHGYASFRQLTERQGLVHCLFANRGRGWAVVLPHHDEYLAADARFNIQEVVQQFAQVRRSTSVVALPWVTFGGPISQRSAFVLEAWTDKAIGRETAQPDEASPLVNPDNVLSLLCEDAVGRPSSLRVHGAWVRGGGRLRVHRYVDLHTPRCEAECDKRLPDVSSVWVVEELRVLVPAPVNQSDWLPGHWCLGGMLRLDALERHGLVRMARWCRESGASSW